MAGDASTLDAPLRKLFASTDVRVLLSNHAPLTWIGMNPNSRALFRWTGRALVDGAERDWTMILKVCQSDPKSDAAEQWTYWKREFLAYSSGILDELPGIFAPRVFGATDEGDVVFVWLEEIVEDGDHRWGTDRYVTAALHLGRFNGAYLAGRPIPNAPFLSRDLLRSWTNWIPWVEVIRDPNSLTHAIVADALPNPPIDRLEGLHTEVGPLFDRLDRLPQTFSHLDAWRSNLISTRGAEGAQRTVAIDWSAVGMAPAGQELAILVGGSHIWLDSEPGELASMSARAYAAYVDGMREAGWRGDERVVRFAYAASTALYLGPPVSFWLARVADPARREWVERKCGRPAVDVVRAWVVLLYHALDLADEAHALVARLDFGH